MCLTKHVSDRLNDGDKNLIKLSVVSSFMSTSATEFILKNDSYYKWKVSDFISCKSPIKAEFPMKIDEIIYIYLYSSLVYDVFFFLLTFTLAFFRV